MLKGLLLIVACIPLYACSLFAEVQEGVYDFKPVELIGETRNHIERQKRELLKLEDIKIGNGPIAAWGRKIDAVVEVRYADGSIAYRGKVLSYVGFRGSVWMQNANSLLLPIEQKGVDFGMNGMAIGGKREFIIYPSLVCTHLGVEANPKATYRFNENTYVRKEQLVVEATLTESCIPVRLFAFVWVVHVNKEVYCRTLAEPKLDPTAPTWRYYH